MSPARVFALDLTPERLEFARGLGAERGFSLNDPSFLPEIMTATRDLGADVVLDFVGEKNSPEVALKILRRGGTYSVIGYGGDLSVPTVAMISREIRILGNFVGNYRDLVELMELQRQGRVKVSAKDFPLSEAPRAIKELRQGRILGRAVLIP